MSGDAAGLIENKASGLDPWPVLLAEISMFLVFATTSKAKMMKHQLAIIVSMNFVFVDSPNNGSCISLFGNNWSIVHVRKMPFVGATCVFLLTGGYAIAQTHRADFKSGDAIVGWNVIVVN
ncbi:hypothetical protein WN944_029385 [Citrus x changshan-huyou]|uniref:Dirigent protein n=1 Tax=Citrus x changshan-huyou TaxID=2935761 RepID=A0AAP0QB19_9ROSI